MLLDRNRKVRDQSNQRGYNELQTIYGSKSKKHVGDDTNVVTNLDSKIIATNNLRDTAARLGDGIILLKEFATLFKNDSCTTRRKQTASVINKLIIPL